MRIASALFLDWLALDIERRMLTGEARTLLDRHGAKANGRMAARIADYYRRLGEFERQIDPADHRRTTEIADWRSPETDWPHIQKASRAGAAGLEPPRHVLRRHCQTFWRLRGAGHALRKLVQQSRELKARAHEHLLESRLQRLSRSEQRLVAEARELDASQSPRTADLHALACEMAEHFRRVGEVERAFAANAERDLREKAG